MLMTFPSNPSLVVRNVPPELGPWHLTSPNGRPVALTRRTAFLALLALDNSDGTEITVAFGEASEPHTFIVKESVEEIEGMIKARNVALIAQAEKEFNERKAKWEQEQERLKVAYVRQAEAGQMVTVDPIGGNPFEDEAFPIIHPSHW